MKVNKPNPITTNKSISIYLIALSVTDIAVLIFSLLVNSTPVSFPQVNNSYAYAVFFSYFGFPMFNFCVLSSVWLEVGVGLNRFIMTKFPFKAQVWNSKRRTIIAIVAVLSSSFMISLPQILMYHPVRVPNGTTIHKTTITDSSHKNLEEFYRFWVNCVFLIVVPWLTGKCTMHQLYK